MEKGESVNFLPAFNNNDNTTDAITRGGSFSFLFVCSLNIFPLRPVSFYRLKLKDKGGKRTNNAKILQSPQCRYYTNGNTWFSNTPVCVYMRARDRRFAWDKFINIGFKF